MHKSLATYARIHWPLEYKDFLEERAYRYPKRLRQIIRANALIGNSEYTFEDWCEDYEDYCTEYYWQGVYDCAETW